jgi:hypothetical protein
MNSVTLRRWHSYIGLLIAPSVLFFAITGALQIFSLHESHEDYHAPVLLQKLGAVHRDQVFQQPRESHDDEHHDADHHEDGHHDEHHDDEAGAAASAAPGTHPETEDDDKMSAATLALKWLFTLVAVGLGLSTLIGVWIGLTQMRSKATAWILLGAGIVLPVLLLMM